LVHRRSRSIRKERHSEMSTKEKEHHGASFLTKAAAAIALIFVVTFWEPVSSMTTPDANVGSDIWALKLEIPGQVSVVSFLQRGNDSSSIKSLGRHRACGKKLQGVKSPSF